MNTRKTRLSLALSSVLLLAIESACVVPAACAILEPGRRGPLWPATAVLAIGLLGWHLAMRRLRRPIWGPDVPAGERLEAARRASVLAAPLRIAAFAAAGLTAAGVAWLAGMGAGPTLAIGTVWLVNAAFPAVLHGIVHDRLLIVPLQDAGEPDALRRFARSYEGRLVRSALAAGGMGVAGASVFMYLFLKSLTLEQFRALQGPFALTAAALTLAFLPIPRWLSRPIGAYLRAPSEALAPAALRCGTALPYRMAAVKVASWGFGAALLGIQARWLAEMSAELAVLCTVAAFLMAVGAAIYETTWHRATLRPMLTEIALRHPPLLRDVRTRLTLRGKILASFGSLAFFVCAFSLFWSFVQYRYLAMSFIQRHAAGELARVTEALRDHPASDRKALLEAATALAPGDAVVHFVPWQGQAFAISGRGPIPPLRAAMIPTIRRRPHGWLDASSLGMQGAFGRIDPQRPERGSLVVLYPGYQARGTDLESHVQFLVLFFVVLFATATGVVTLVARDLSRPVRLLEQRAESMGQGDLSSAVPIGPEPDEMGRLAVAFEEMRRALGEKIAALEELHASLEQKVADRTADLELSNLELRQTLVALRQAQDKLVASEKMAVVGQLTAGVAHEINNPINAVVNTVEPLEQLVASLTERSGTALPSSEARQELGEMLRVIKSGAERTKRIVQALRNYARGDRDEAVDYEIHRGLDEALELLRHELRGSIEVERDYGAVGPLRCRPGQLNQVFVNLITNAAQALHGQTDGRIVLRTRNQNGAVEVEVADNGPGISAETLSRVFDPFFTTKPVGEGTGLGLSISQQIVERHGGTLRVDSEPGHGATFTVRLPRG